ncbi:MULTISPECIES: SpoIIE family protein phosphatase [Streptomyces]|uniref:Probable regulatory protein n=1 Tax=Streptomyces venezuelae (strain ATCC 10712 / CBS 650.69 / DSM 40230 / JCM 4526 / NBRC 13096 / PD 04745) TaxID=953739 RepID=F2R1E2_STRVP|nr:SpoIIE family protein phosphatase [Streptomyces venezuelae]APE23690.1 PAS sensor protein [Streptomyces venezuelae]QES01062.1 PAS domain S-box protein [Streptomyces venezuelae ATCC 10712]QES08158.1 PAS domain S-box protein [Streptomyces venezuelae]QES13170.1 PAS domain S-box protein [Streptomyces venezuelae]CCA58033.1 probable regulatory protein [Streptomyces venezuelae ATCC 10712]
MSEIPEKASGGVVWQSSPPGSIYDYIRVASFSIGPDGLVEQWSRRAVDLFGVTAEEARGKDPVEAFMPADLRERGHRRVREILDGKEWTGLVPFRMPGEDRPHGIAEMYVMPSETQTGERAALCIVVDVRALRRIETDLAASQAIFGQSPFGFLLFGTDLTVKRANRRFATVFGGSADDHRGRTVHDYLNRPEADRMTAALKSVLETGESVTDFEIVGAAPGARDRRHWSINLYRVHSGSGRPIGVAGLGIDVTRRHNAAREAASARRNLALLNEAGARIGNSLDLEATARELLDVAVPGFCDLASVDLYQGLLTGDEAPPGRWGSSHDIGYGAGSAELRRVAVASAVSDTPLRTDEGHGPGSGCCGPEPIEVGAVHRYSFNSPCAGALRTGRLRTVPGADGDLVQTTLVVPMVAHDTVVGLVQFSRAKGSESFGERDRALAVELAARAAVCIDNARLYRREHERALILQRSLLPPGDPEAAGLDIACRYLPGTAATEVGGDWFDVIELPGHRTALVIGDVMGRGLRAAVAMGELRTAVRTLAQLDLEPAEVLSHLDEIARGLGAPIGAQQSRSHKSRGPELSEVYLATCVYAVYDPVTRRCTFANAGHLPPVLVEPGEEALLLDVPPGMPLGVGGEPFEEVEVELPEGALLALYTDGLVESRDHPLDEGLSAFRRALTDPARPLEDVCDRVLNSLDTEHGEDDIALLMARIQGLPSESVGDWRLPREPRSVGRARELARTQLKAWDLEPLVDTVELLVSELVTNALRYGEGEIRLRLLRDRTLVCEVWDSGLVQPRRRRAKDTDEGGRGLQLVGLLSSSWGSRRTPRGKTVWFELALPDGEGAAEPTVEQLLSMF